MLKNRVRPRARFLAASLVALLTAGCSSVPKQYADPDGVSYRAAAHNIRVWVADGFDFSGYEILYLTETGSTVKPPSAPAQVARIQRLQEVIRASLAVELGAQKIVSEVVPETSVVPAEARALKLQTDIVDYYAGSMTGRILVGFGAGSPYVMVRGKLTDPASARPLMCFVAKRGFEGADLGFSNESVLRNQIRDLAKDVASVASRLKNHQPLN